MGKTDDGADSGWQGAGRDHQGELTDRVAKLAEAGIVPGLGTVLVGDDPGSRSYVAGKHRDCAQVGIASIQVELPADTTAELCRHGSRT